MLKAHSMPALKAEYRRRVNTPESSPVNAWREWSHLPPDQSREAIARQIAMVRMGMNDPIAHADVRLIELAVFGVFSTDMQNPHSKAMTGIVQRADTNRRLRLGMGRMKRSSRKMVVDWNCG